MTEPDITPGIYNNVPMEDYHRGPGISKSDLDLVAKSPADFRVVKDHPKPPTPLQQMGAALHCRVLEPHEFDQRFVPDPHPGSTAKAAKAARAELEAQGLTIIQTAKQPADYWARDDWRSILGMATAIEAHPTANTLLRYGGAEKSVYWVDERTGLLCKCRPDKLDAEVHSCVIDLKSTGNATFSEFLNTARRYRYHKSAAYYLDGLTANGVECKHYLFVVVERDPPYGVNVFDIRPGSREYEFGRTLYRRDLNTVAECIAANSWPSYGGSDPEVRDLVYPEWAFREEIS